MLGIKIKDQFISIFANTVLGFEMNHPVGMIVNAIDLLQGGFSFPMEIPLDDVNISIFGSVNRLDVDSILLQDEPCQVWVDGVILYEGLAHIKGAAHDRAILFMTFNYTYDLKDVILPSIDYEGNRELGTDEESRTATAQDTAENPLNHDFIFCPVFNPNYRNEFWEAQFPTAQQQWIQNYYDYEDNQYTEYAICAVTPFVRLDYILKRIFNHIGFTIDNQFQDSDELKLILLYNNYNINTHSAAAVSKWDNTINLKNHVPHRNAIDLIKAVIGTFALGLFPDYQNKTMELIPFKKLIEGPEHADWTSKASAKWTYESDKDFISHWRYGLDDNDDMSIRYSLQEMNVSDQYADFDELFLDEGTRPNQNCYLHHDNTYYFYKENIRVDYLGQDFKEIKKGGTEHKFTSELIPMWNSHDLEIDCDINDELRHQEIMLPAIEHVGYDVYWGDAKQTLTSFRTMIYRGMQPAYTEDWYYPMAGATNYNIRGERVGDYDLRWNGNDGIFAKFWEPVHGMLKNKKLVTRLLNLSIADIMNFRFKHKIRIENQNYFILQMRFTISHRGLSTVEAIMMTTL